MDGLPVLQEEVFYRNHVLQYQVQGFQPARNADEYSPQRVEKLIIAVAFAYLIVFLWGLAETRKESVNKVYR